MAPNPSPEKLDLRALLLRATALPLGLMLLAAAVLVWQVTRLRELSAWVDHTDVVLRQANDLVLLDVEQENALRGLLLTGEDSFRERYTRYRASYAPAMTELQRLVSDNPSQVERARGMEQLHAAVSSLGDDALAGRAAPHRAAALERRQVLDQIRAAHAGFVEVEEGLRRERSARARAGARTAIGSTIALSLVVALLLATLVRAQTRRIAARYGELMRSDAERARALAESEERFRLFVEGVHDSAIYMVDTGGRVLTWNAGAERIKGYRPEEIVGRDVAVFYTPEDVEAGLPARELAEAAERGQVEGESWRVRKDGSRFWAAVTVRTLRGADGRIVGYAKLVRDTTERKRADMRRSAQFEVAQALASAATVEEALPRLLAGLSAALGYELGLAWRPEGGVLRVVESWLRPSSRGAAFVEVKRAAVLRPGDPIAGLAWQRRQPIWVDDMRRHLADVPRAPYAVEAGLYSALVLPVTTGSDVGLVLELFAGDPREEDADLLQMAGLLSIQIGAFIERQEAREAEREAERRRAEELERRVEERTVELTAVNRELEAFSYSVSHDLRAPLRAMDGFSQVLLEDYGDQIDATGKDYLARVRAASQRMSQLIDDLIQLSRVTRGELRREAVDLSALFRDVVAEVQAREPDRRVRAIVADGVQVRGDARLLRAGLVNLVANAFKFTRKREDPVVEFGAVDGLHGREYFVRDNGAGFDMAYAAKLFQPFQRLHATAEFEGTGIGLATWQRIVHRHGGRVWADGAPDRGATFYFTLGGH